MKLWIDDCRPAPDGYVWLKSTNEALRFIVAHYNDIEEISFDHDAGEYVRDGGDYIEILDELERLSYSSRWSYVPKHLCEKSKFHLHTANPVGAANMRRIIQKNGWREIK